MTQENSKIYEMQINTIRNSFAEYCQNCRGSYKKRVLYESPR